MIDLSCLTLIRKEVAVVAAAAVGREATNCGIDALLRWHVTWR